MTEKTEPRITAQKRAVLKSFQGQALTDAQTDIAMNLANVINRHIHKTGSFREPLDELRKSRETTRSRSVART